MKRNREELKQCSGLLLLLARCDRKQTCFECFNEEVSKAAASIILRDSLSYNRKETTNIVTRSVRSQIDINGCIALETYMTRVNNVVKPW